MNENGNCIFAYPFHTIPIICRLLVVMCLQKCFQNLQNQYLKYLDSIYIMRKKSLITWHADASKSARIVETTSLILARMRFALVDVRLTTRSSEALTTVASKRAGNVDAKTIMLTRRALEALVDVLRAVWSLVALRARTGERAVDGIRFTDGILMAWIRDTRVIQMAQQTSLSRRTLTAEAADAIDASRSTKTRSVDAVIDILRAVVARPSIYANASETSVGISACCAVLTYARPSVNERVEQ